jgi:hypothetical protein
MRSRILLFAIVIAIMTTAVPVDNTISQGPTVPTNDLTIDEQWIYIYQQEDRTTLKVEEYTFFNNTGTSPYNGTIYDWAPRGSIVRSECCGNALDMACRMKDLGYMFCFTVGKQNDTILYGSPFSSTSFMSYFGQSAKITVGVQSQNYSDSDSLELNVTLGAESEAPQTLGTVGPGVHIESNRTELGVMARVDYNQPVNLTILQTLNITNNGTGNDTLDLGIQDLPQGWGGSFLDNGIEVTSVALNVTEDKNITLMLSAPSYLVEVLISYSVNIPATSKDKWESVFEKEVLYDTGGLFTYIYALDDTNLTVSDNLNLHISTGIENYTFHVVTSHDLPQGSTMSLAISWDIESDLSWLVLAAIIAAVLLLGGLALLSKRKREAREAAKAGEEKGKAKGAKKKSKPKASKAADASVKTDLGDLMKQRESVREALGKLDSDHKSGLIPGGTYIAMKKKLEKKEHDIDARIEDSNKGGVDALEEEKRKLLKAIKNLEKDHESGNISKEVYNELHSEYKRSTIEIIKEIDRKKGA